MTYWHNHMGTGGWIFSILGTLIVVALIIAAIVWLVSSLGPRGRGTSPGASAREILDRRLASGELTIEQYEQHRDALDEEVSRTQDPRSPRPASAAG